MRILIVEDNYDEMQRAEAIVKAAGHEVETAMTVSRALDELGKEGWDKTTEKRTLTKKADAPDAVLSDVMVGWGTEKGRVEVPGGVLVGWACDRLGIPFVFCTSGYHHGSKFNWACVFGRMNNWPEMVDGDVQTREDRERHLPKRWELALECLMEEVEKRKAKGG